MKKATTPPKPATPKKRAAPAKKVAAKKVAAKKAPATPAKKAPAKAPPQPAKKAPAKKAAPKSPGGSVAASKTTAKVGGRKTIPPDATVLTTDEEFAESVVAQLKKKFTPEKIAEALEEIVAHGTYTNKHGEDRPDAKTRLTAIEKVMMFTVGKPVDKVQNITATTYTYDEIEQLIEHSPELRRALRMMLAKFDQEDGV